ncbi:unnamed protein product [Urochloa humidicola]
MAFLLPCLSLLLLELLISYVKQLITDARRHLPPGPWPLPIIGNILHMSNLPHRALARLADRHGELMTVRLGTSLYVVASSPSAAREILQTHNASLSGRSPADAWSGGRHGDNSVFVLQPGRKRRALRRLGTAHMFSPARLQETLALRRDAVAGLLRDVSEAAPASCGGPVTERSPRGLYDSVREAMALVMTPNVSDLFPAVAAADLQGVRRRFAALIAKGYRMMDGQIERRKLSRKSGCGARRNDLLEAMLDMSEQGDHSGVSINRDVIRAFCTDLFIAALDTTSWSGLWQN